MTKPRKRDVMRAIKNGFTYVPYDALKEAFDKSALSKLTFVGLDNEYVVLTRAAWEKVLAWSGVNDYKYKSDTRDCDNFAAALHGTIPLRLGVNTVGYVVDWSGGHAYNAVAVMEEGGPLTIAAVEPQTDGFVAVGDQASAHEAYTATNGFVLWG